MSIITTMLTVYCGLFFISHQPEVYQSSDSAVKEADNGCKYLMFSLIIVRISEGTQLFFFFVILFSNLGFFIYWLYKIIGEVRNTLRKKFNESLLMDLIVWEQRIKLEEEIRKRIIEDEHDLLYYQFQKRIL